MKNSCLQSSTPIRQYISLIKTTSLHWNFIWKKIRLKLEFIYGELYFRHFRMGSTYSSIPSSGIQLQYLYLAYTAPEGVLMQKGLASAKKLNYTIQCIAKNRRLVIFKHIELPKAYKRTIDVGKWLYTTKPYQATAEDATNLHACTRNV